MTPSSPPLLAQLRKEAPNIAILAGVLLAALTIAGIMLYTHRQDSATRKYVEESDWYQECVETLGAATAPLVKEWAIAEHCRMTARHGEKYGPKDRLLTVLAYKNPADKTKIDQYLYREQPLPGCGRYKCKEPNQK